MVDIVKRPCNFGVYIGGRGKLSDWNVLQSYYYFNKGHYLVWKFFDVFPGYTIGYILRYRAIWAWTAAVFARRSLGDIGWQVFRSHGVSILFYYITVTVITELFNVWLRIIGLFA